MHSTEKVPPVKAVHVKVYGLSMFQTRALPSTQVSATGLVMRPAPVGSRSTAVALSSFCQTPAGAPGLLK